MVEDTSPAAARRYLELLRAMTESERMDQTNRLCRTTRTLCEAGVRSRHPGATDADVRARVAAIMYGRPVAAKLFPGADLDDL